MTTSRRLRRRPAPGRGAAARSSRVIGIGGLVLDGGPAGPVGARDRHARRAVPRPRWAATGQAAQQTHAQVAAALGAAQLPVAGPADPVPARREPGADQRPAAARPGDPPRRPEGGYVVIYELPSNGEAERVGHGLPRLPRLRDGRGPVPARHAVRAPAGRPDARVLPVVAAGLARTPARPTLAAALETDRRAGRAVDCRPWHRPSATLLRGEGKTATGFEVPPEVVEAPRRRQAAARHRDDQRRLHLPLDGLPVHRGRSCSRSPPSTGPRRASQAGDEIEVTLELDTAPREVEVPPELAAALEADPQAKVFFDGLSYSNKRVFTLTSRGRTTPRRRPAAWRARSRRCARAASARPRRLARAACPATPDPSTVAQVRTRSRLTLNVCVRGKSASGHRRQPGSAGSGRGSRSPP